MNLEFWQREIADIGRQIAQSGRVNADFANSSASQNGTIVSNSWQKHPQIIEIVNGARGKWSAQTR